MAFTHNSKVAEKEPAWGEVDKTKLPRPAFADKGEDGKKSTWKYPHHWIEGGGAPDENGVYTTGTMYLHGGGLDAAWSAAQGGRSGEKASSEVISHLDVHRKALGKDSTVNQADAAAQAATPPAAASANPPAAAAAPQIVQLVDLVDIEIGQFPCTDVKGRKYGVETADQLVETYAAFGDRIKAPFVLGHNEADSGKITTGMPALGWGVKLTKKVVAKGVKVLANIGQVPAIIADLVKKGAYKRISQAFWPDGADAGIPEAKGKAVLRHIGLLGADTPRVKTLEDVQALYTGSTPPQAAFADSAEADVAEFADSPSTTATEGPQSLPEAIQAVQVADDLEPLLDGLQSRVWVLTGDAREGKTREEVLAGLADLASELSRIVSVLRTSPAATPAEAATATTMMADANATAGTGNGELGTGKEKTAGAPAKGAGEQAVATANPAAAAPAKPPVAAAASPAPATATIPNPESRIPAPAVEMSDSARQAVEVFITRTTAAGKLLPKHHPAIRAVAAACFAHGGEEALTAYIDDQEALRQATVIKLGETGKAGAKAVGAAASAEFADLDAGAVAHAEADFEQYEMAKKFPGLTKAAYVKSWAGKK